MELYLWTGDTFAPGGNVTVGDADTSSDFEEIGKMNDGGYDITIYGDIIIANAASLLTSTGYLDPGGKRECVESVLE